MFPYINIIDVETKMLMRAIKRNLDRFPDDFMVQLTKEEFDDLRYHFAPQNGRQAEGGIQNNKKSVNAKVKI